MKTIETKATVKADGTLTVQLTDIPPGEYQLVLVIGEPATTPKPITVETNMSLKFQLFDVGTWPENLSLRREDMYDDNGR